MDENLVRWIKASIDKHFKAKCDAKSLPIYFDNFPHETTTIKNWCELRMDGPYITPTTRDKYKIRVEINILVSSGKNQPDGHKLQRHQGVICNAFETIPVLKLGDGADDDQSHITCLILDKGIIVSNFGQVNETTQFLQSSVEARYRADYSE